MKRIHNQANGDKARALNVLNWVTYAKRSMQAAELLHAIAVETNSGDIDDDDLMDIEDLVSPCVGIVTVDKESGIIRLVHETTQKYLERKLPAVDVFIAKTYLT